VAGSGIKKYVDGTAGDYGPIKRTKGWKETGKSNVSTNTVELMSDMSNIRAD
jgi:hypothetical protein